MARLVGRHLAKCGTPVTCSVIIVSRPVFGKTCGPLWFGNYLTNGEQPHSLVVAPTRAGKGVGVVIPTLLTFKGTVIALDVKGELLS